jgi:GNAT superfamily N-acetyltransferase
VAADLSLRVVEVGAARTHDLRRRVLREGMENKGVNFPSDHHPEALHLAVVDGDVIVAVASYTPESTPLRPGARAVRLRGMAVEAAWRGRGVGRLLMRVACERLRGAGFDLLWANARDSALGFYEGLGMEVVGDGFDSVGLPHHVVVRALADPDKPVQSGPVDSNR